jgi:CRP/FNR family cyclic AMP-dependent transcriptional regulator
MAEIVPILECDPDLGEDLSADRLQAAHKRVMAEIVRYPRGPWPVNPDDFDARANFGMLLIDGLLAREVTVAGYTCAELLGPGDVLQPWLRIGPDQSVATEVDWDVVAPVQAAVLGRRFSTSAAPWPEIGAAVSRRVMHRTHWLAFHLAVAAPRRRAPAAGAVALRGQVGDRDPRRGAARYAPDP